MKRNQFIAISMMALSFCLPTNAQNTFGDTQVFGNQQRTHQQGQERRGFHHREYCLSDSDFSILHSKVKKASFDDNKLDLIEVANLGCHYSCQQVARIIKLFSFSDGKMKALQMMAPHIVDPQNAVDIYKQFTFSSEKDRAAEIIRNSGRQNPR